MFRDKKTKKEEVVVAVRKNSEGDIVSLKTNAGRIINYSEALAEAKSGDISGINVFKGKDGGNYIRSNADGNPDNNLDNLPTF